MTELAEQETGTCICGRAIYRDAETPGSWVHDETNEIPCNRPGFSSTYAMPSRPEDREHWALLIRKNLVD